VLKRFLHLDIAADRGGRNGPCGLEVLHLPEWTGISGQVHVQQSGQAPGRVAGKEKAFSIRSPVHPTTIPTSNSLNDYLTQRGTRTPDL
jgi:hypothetical protein